MEVSNPDCRVEPTDGLQLYPIEAIMRDWTKIFESCIYLVFESTYLDNARLDPCDTATCDMTHRQ